MKDLFLNIGVWMKPRLLPIFILMGSALFFAATINPVRPAHTDSIVFATVARDMVQSGDWIVPRFNGQPDFWKPPLQYWLIALAYRSFGISPVSAVLPSLGLAVLGVWIVYHLGTIFWNQRGGAISALVLATNLHYYEASRMAMMDLGLSVLILLALGCWVRSVFLQDDRWRIVIGFYGSMALAVLMKGPQGAVIPLGIVGLYSLWAGILSPVLQGKRALFGTILFLLIALPWYIGMALQFGERYIQHFFFQENVQRILGANVTLWDRLIKFPQSFFEAFAPFGLWNLLLWPAIGLGVRELFRAKSGDRRAGFLTLWVLSLFLGFSFTWANAARYFQPFIPGASLLVGGIAHLIPWEGRPWRWGGAAAIALSVFFVCAVAGAALGIWPMVEVPDTTAVWFILGWVLFFLVTAGWILRFQRWHWVPIQWGFFTGWAILFCFGWLPSRIALNPVADLARHLQEVHLSDLPIGVTGYDAQKELIYFVDVHPRVVTGLSETLDFLARHPRACLIASRSEYDRFPEEARRTLKIQAVAKGWPVIRMRLLNEPDPIRAAFRKVEWLLLVQDRSASS